MGRHADPDRRAFWGSFALAAGKAALVLAVIGALTALVASMAGPMGEQRGPTVMIAESPGTPDATAAPTPATPTPMTPAPTATLATPQATPSPTPAATVADPTPTPAPADVGGVSVQILNSGASADAVGEVEALLEEWGYDVVAVGPGRCCYDTTTVFYSQGRQADADALAERDPRFVVVELNTDLDQSVDLHVVLGEDWSSGEP